MTLDIEINFNSRDFEIPLKWYSMIKEPNKQDIDAYNKLKILVDSMKKDEKEEREAKE